MGQPIEIFCCAAEVDRSFLGQLSTQLSLQQQQGIITLWDESQVPAGGMVDQEIQRHLASARIFLLLISPDFLASHYCYNRVMKAALERHGRGEAITIPVIVRPAIWQDASVLKHIQVLPRNGLPISGQRDRDYALWEVAKEISMAVQRLGQPGVQSDSGVRHSGLYAGMASPQTGRKLDTGTFPPGSPAVGYPPMMKVGNPFSPPVNARKKMRVILMLSVISIILVAGVAFTFFSKGSSNLNGNRPDAASTHVSSTSSVTTPVKVQSTPTMVPNILPTASLSSPQLPLALHCVDCAYPPLSVALNRIDMDSPAQSSRWVFAFQNNGQHPCSPTFWTVYLTDPSGTNYSGKGQVAEGESFSLDVGQSVQETSVFAVLPTSGTVYTLTLQIHVGACNGSGPLNPYQTANFTFA